MNFFAKWIWTLCLALTLATSAHAQAPNPAFGLANEPKVADAKPDELRVMATGAMRGPLESVHQQAEKTNGGPIFIEYGSARGNLKSEILAGQDFEVALLLPDVNAEILKQEKILPQHRYEIARIPVALGLRGEVAKLDISTPETLKKVLLNAKSVRYAPTGAAHDTVDKIFSTLGIADTVKDASRAGESAPLAPGEYEIGIYPLSEIIPDKTWKNLGVVPAELQVPVIIEAVVGAHAKDQKAAIAFIHFLQGPAIEPGLRASGMIKGQSK
jgi:molybdate transport system substrate-binding protein